MKTTQAWGWLAAGVLAAGLNASYYNGGAQWAHRAVDRVVYRSAAVLALASGHTDSFLAQARFAAAQDQTASCRFATVLTRLQTGAARTETKVARFETMSAREEAALARLEANRARIEAQVEAATARWPVVSADFNPASFNRVIFSPGKVPTVCPRVRVNIPRPPMLRIPATVVHIDMAGAGPV